MKVNVLAAVLVAMWLSKMKKKMRNFLIIQQ